jgi:hypothetical protein
MAVFLVTEQDEHLRTEAWRCLEVELS